MGRVGDRRLVADLVLEVLRDVPDAVPPPEPVVRQVDGEVQRRRALVTSAAGASAAAPRMRRSRCMRSACTERIARKNTTVIQVKAGMKSLLARFSRARCRGTTRMPGAARAAAYGDTESKSRYEIAPNVTYQMSMTAIRESTMKSPSNATAAAVTNAASRHRGASAREIRDADQQRAADGVEDAVAARLAAEERDARADRELRERRVRIHEVLAAEIVLALLDEVDLVEDELVRLLDAPRSADDQRDRGQRHEERDLLPAPAGPVSLSGSGIACRRAHGRARRRRSRATPRATRASARRPRRALRRRADRSRRSARRRYSTRQAGTARTPSTRQRAPQPHRSGARVLLVAGRPAAGSRRTAPTAPSRGCRRGRSRRAGRRTRSRGRGSARACASST